MSETRTAIERWRLPEVDGPIVGRVREERRHSAAAESSSAAQHDAEARGYQAGIARAQAEADARIAALDDRVRRLDQVLQLLGRPLDALDAEVESGLLQLALAVGKNLARRELKAEPAQVIALVRESLALLPVAAREIRVHLHPEDAATVRERLAPVASERAWTLVEDPTLSRGGCVIQSQSSRIDGKFESRIAALAASLFGDERARQEE